MGNFKEGDWVVYNWLTSPDENGNQFDNWKVGLIVEAPNGDLMHYNDDSTNRSGYIPLTSGGVKKLFNQ